MGRTPVPKRKKAQTEVEILKARLHTIESAYSERLSQMESLLNRVMPGAQIALAQDLNMGNGSGPGLGPVLEAGTRTGPSPAPGSSVAHALTLPTTAPSGHDFQGTESSNDSKWADIDSPQEAMQQYVPSWDRSTASTSGLTSERSSASLFSSDMHTGTTGQSFPKDKAVDDTLFLPTSQAQTTDSSPAPSIVHSSTSAADITHGESDSDSDSGLGELAATMDRLRIFDASYYFGKGTMMFSSTDKTKMWDEEISLDVHGTHDIDIPPEALIMPATEVIDALIDIYYSYYYPFLPMIKKTTLLQSMDDRYEPQSIFLLNSVFMAAALTGDYVHPCLYSDPNNPKTLATPFFERARLVLDYCIGIPRVSTVQGLILLSRYPKVLGLGHHYIQQAILMASDLGLHRKCDRWIPDVEVQEIRRRVFWCVYAVDSSASSITGRAPLLNDNEIDVSMVVPTATEGELEYSNTLYLVHICKLWRIFRNVKQYIFNALDVQEMVPGSLPKSYEQQLIQWQLQLPAALRFSFDLKEDDPRVMYNARGGIAQMLYESTLILLHKPYISSDETVKRSPYRSLDICSKAATKITDISKFLARTYIRTFEITGVAEYATANALRIHVFFMGSDDPKVAEPNRANFYYMMQFFREYYSSPRNNIDDQSINCFLTFFDEFLSTLNGLSESTVHVCASAIKNMVIAKRSKIALAGLPGGHGEHPVPPDGDSRNLSRVVKIGREVRAKARVNSSNSSPKDGHNTYRKRLSHMQHDDQQRCTSTPQLRPHHQHIQQQGSTMSSVSSLENVQNSGDYLHPIKAQKVSQYIGSFGGSVVMESLNQYQTSNLILSQPPSTSAIPQSNGVSSSAVEMFEGFAHQPTQQQFQHQQAPAQQCLQTQPQPQTQFLNHPIQPMGNFDALNPSFWGDFEVTGETAASLQPDAQILNPEVSQANSSVFSNVSNASTSLPTEFLNPTNIFGISTPDEFHPADPQQQQGLQQPTASSSSVFMSLKMNQTTSAPEEMDEELNADQIQALLDRTLSENTHTTPNDLSNSNGPAGSAATASMSQQQQQQLIQNQSQGIGLDEVHEDFYSTSWHNM
ncbi:Transcriptional activator of fatty acid utilization [Mortierella polycephala]|uniref:Transcriptional activator of fatty acid utilization n=1 Tax=Mortierella polycephala TaxID=41804 RepID=A0A9P6QD47_9FUNG|nr:Transcriptional activator of fatty acid utilization [Mortierella polycephala]